MKITLIRHGMTEANEKHLYCGSTDIPLSEAGKEQLIALRKEGGYPEYHDGIYITSGLKRCRETLEILYGDVGSVTEPDLQEMDFGVFEMHSYEELKTREDYQDWITGDNEMNVTPGGESGKIMTERVLKAFDRIRTKGRNCVIITHGGVIAAVMAYCFPEEEKNRYEWQPGFGKGYEVMIDGECMVYHPIMQGLGF